MNEVKLVIEHKLRPIFLGHFRHHPTFNFRRFWGDPYDLGSLNYKLVLSV